MMFLLISLLLAFQEVSSAKPPPPPQPHWPAQYQFQYSVTNQFRLSWTINGTNLMMKVESDKNAWAGISIGQGSDGMSGGDMIIATVENNKVVVKDYMAKCKCEPTLDTKMGGTNDIKYRGSLSNGKLEFEFMRPLKTSDKNDVEITQGSLSMAWAVGRDVPFAEHTGAGQFMLDLYTGKGSKGGPIILVHAVLMPVAYGVLMVLGIMIALYAKKNPKWFKFHIGLQVTATVFALVGAAIGFVSTGSHFTEVHHYLGILTLVPTIAQPFLGWLADKLWNPKRDKVPVFPDKLHWWLGYATIALSAAAIITGIIIISGSYVYVAIYGTWMGIVTLVCAIGWLLRLYGDSKHASSSFASKLRHIFNPHAVDKDVEMTTVH